MNAVTALACAAAETGSIESKPRFQEGKSWRITSSIAWSSGWSWWEVSCSLRGARGQSRTSRGILPGYDVGDPPPIETEPPPQLPMTPAVRAGFLLDNASDYGVAPADYDGDCRADLSVKLDGGTTPRGRRKTKQALRTDNGFDDNSRLSARANGRRIVAAARGAGAARRDVGAGARRARGREHFQPAVPLLHGGGSEIAQSCQPAGATRTVPSTSTQLIPNRMK